jgi:DNA-binding NtrC family response regulator
MESSRSKNFLCNEVTVTWGCKCSQKVICGVLNVNEAESKTQNNGDVQAGHREAEIAGHRDSVGDYSLRSFRNEAEIRAVNYALEQAGWNRRRAAKLLSISYRSLLYKIRQHNITPAVEPAKQLSHR